MKRIGIICPSEIAFRRFLPALKEIKDAEFAGVAVATPEEWFGDSLSDTPKDTIEQVRRNEFKKADSFVEQYGGKVIDGYENLIKSEDIDVVYLPLPPALHYKWAKKVISNRKHLFCEKPFTISKADTYNLIEAATKQNVAFHENYMFAFHKQIEDIKKIVADGEIGNVRLIRIDFGFPKRAQNDFRYNKKLGGGALFDCGGYPVKLARILLGGDVHITDANFIMSEEHNVDLYGSATLKNEKGDVAQISFGMDNDYRCNLDIWGSEGSIFTGRILTAPSGFVPMATIRKNGVASEIELSADDTFKKSIEYFLKSIDDESIRKKIADDIKTQADLIDEFIEKSEMK